MAKIVERSQCKLAHRMKGWSAWDTLDNSWHQKEGTIIKLTNNDTTLDNDIFLQPLLDDS